MGLTQRAVLVVFKGRKIVKKRIYIFHLCIISIIFLFLITMEAVAGTYVYYNEKGEKVSYINKNESQNLNNANTESVQSVHTGKNKPWNNDGPIDNDLQDENQQDKNRKNHRKR